MTARIAVVVAVLLAALAPAAGAQEAPAPADACGTAFPAYEPAPVASGVQTLSDQAITMSDGAVLRADVHLPSGLDGPFPTALTITGYGRSIGGSFGGGGGLGDHGYATVIVDDRGTGGSGGRWDSWGERTIADYPEVLDWIVAQPWSDGRVGLSGGSYMGITALYAAASGHPAVEAVFATVPMADAYRDIVFGGGQVNTAFIPLWMGLVTGLSVAAADGPEVLVEHLLAVTEFQLPTIADALVGGASAYDGPFWRQRSPIERVDDIDVPTFIVGGLDDIFQRGEPLLYEALAEHTDARLLIGPWSHIAAGAGLPRDGVPALDPLTLQWFDEHVRGLDAGADCIPPVTQYLRGADRYRIAPTWPVPDLEAQRWHLRGGGGLTTDAPGAEVGSTYLQLPLNGLCSRSTAQWLIGVLDSTPCATDNRLDEATALTWTSEPFAGDVEINGPIQADVWLRPLISPEAMVSVAISDVAPDGASRGLTNGLLLASHRAVDVERSRFLDGQSIQPWHPFTAEAQQAVVPGQPVLAPVEVFPTSAVIRAGHRLRVTIAAYDVPHALPPVPAVLSTLAGPVEVLNDAEHPSSVVLPVVTVDAADGADGPAPAPGPAPNPGADAADRDVAGAASEPVVETAASAPQLPATGGGVPLALAVLIAGVGLGVRRGLGGRLRAGAGS